MSDVVVTVPKRLWREWIAEGDLPGEEAQYESHFWVWGFVPVVKPGDRVYVVAFVTQDGCRSDLVPWGAFDWLFVGGSDAWKLSEASWQLVREAKLRGLGVHVGRVNSWRRLKACAVSGVDSADGTYLKFGPDVNWPKLIGWLDDVNGQGRLEVAS